MNDRETGNPGGEGGAQVGGRLPTSWIWSTGKERGGLDAQEEFPRWWVPALWTWRWRRQHGGPQLLDRRHLHRVDDRFRC